MPLPLYKYFRLSIIVFTIISIFNNPLFAQYQRVLKDFETLKPVERGTRFWGAIEEMALPEKELNQFVSAATKFAINNNDKVLLREISFMKNLWKISSPSTVPALTKELKKDIANGNTLEVGYWYHAIAQLNFRAGDYAEFYENYFKAMEIFEQTGFENVPSISKFLHDFALSYYYFKEYEEVIKLMKISIKYPPFNANHDIQRYNNLAMAYFHSGKNDSTHYYLKKTYAVAEKYHSDIWKTIVTDNFATMHYKQGNYAKALNDYLQILKNSSGEDYYQLVFKAYIHISKIYVKTNLTRKAKLYLDSAEMQFKILKPKYFGDEQQIELFKQSFFKAKKRYYTAVGDYKNAIIFSDTLHKMELDIAQRYNSKIAKLSSDKLELNKRELTISKAQREKLSLNIFYIILVAVILICAAIGFSFIFVKRQNDKVAYLILVNQNKLDLAEKDRIAIELINAKKEIGNFVEKISEHSDIISSLEADLKKMAPENPNNKHHVDTALQRLKTARILTDDDWLAFLRNFQTSFPAISHALKTYTPALTVSEMRYLMLSHLGFSNKEMARAIGVSESGIRLTFSRVKKKLNGTSEDTATTLMQKLTNYAETLANSEVN